MDTILSFFTSGIGGGLIGALGGLGTAWIKYKSDKQSHEFKLEEMKAKNDYNLKMVSAQTEASIREVEANVHRDQIIMEGKADIEESKGRNEAILKLSENYVKESLVERMMFNTNKWTAWLSVPISFLIILLQSGVDILRTLVRPAITYGSVGFSFYVLYLSYTMYKELGIVMSSEDLFEIIMTMLKLLVFITSTVISYWFLDRAMSRRMQEGYGK